MKKTTLRAALAAVLLLTIGSSRADAASWRINNDASKHAHFTDINAAMSSSDVTDGDTLYLDPGCKLTTQQDVTKRVTIIGCGHTTTGRTYDYATITGGLYLKAEGIKVIALHINSKTALGAEHITLERCRTGLITYISESQPRYATIRQCFVRNRITGAGSSNSAERMMTAYWTIENSIILDTISGLYNAVIRNNYIRTSYNSSSCYPFYELYSCTITNNIILHTGNYWNYISIGDHYNMYSHNVMSNKGTYFYSPNGVENQFPKNTNKLLGEGVEANIFTMTGDLDEQYRLKDDSPAKGYATDGGDCGPYGGLYPYVPGGLPLGMAVPTASTVPTNAQDGHIRISLQAGTQKQ